MLDFFYFVGGENTHTHTQHANKTPFSSFPPSALLLLDGWGHRGRVKVTSGRRGVGLGLSEGGGGGRGRGGCIKTDRTQVVLYPPCPALGKRKPLKCSGSTSYFFSPPPPHSHYFSLRPDGTCARSGREMAASPARRTMNRPCKMLAFALLLVASLLSGK